MFLLYLRIMMLQLCDELAFYTYLVVCDNGKLSIMGVHPAHETGHLEICEVWLSSEYLLSFDVLTSRWRMSREFLKSTMKPWVIGSQHSKIEKDQELIKRHQINYARWVCTMVKQSANVICGCCMRITAACKLYHFAVQIAMNPQCHLHGFVRWTDRKSVV